MYQDNSTWGGGRSEKNYQNYFLTKYFDFPLTTDLQSSKGDLFGGSAVEKNSAGTISLASYLHWYQKGCPTMTNQYSTS